MEAITNYFDQTLSTKRKFVLTTDAILVSGSTLSGTRYELRVPLENLDPIYSKIFFRQSAFWVGVGLVGGVLFLCFILGSIPETVWFSGSVISIIILGILGLILALMTAQQLEVARFRTSSGVIGIDVICSCKAKEEFQTFVDAIVRQIKISRKLV